MANHFIIRVELHDVPKGQSEQVYADLHDRMAGVKCLRQTSDTDGGRYDLPSAMYDFKTDTSYTARQIDDFVRPVISRSGYRYNIMVIKAIDMSYDLPLAIQNLSELMAALRGRSR